MTASDIIIREARPGDAPAIASFQLAMARETEGLELNAQTLRQGVEAVFRDPGLGRYFIAEADDRPLASLMITYEWSDWRNGWVWWIQSVYVIPAFRGKGLYSRMYAQLQDRVQAGKDALGLRLYVDQRNVSAIEVYRRLGMDDGHYTMFEWFPADRIG